MECEKRVFIVEDHEDMRYFYHRLLKKAGYEVCGEAATAEIALEGIPSAKPDLVIIDISLPGINGIELVRMLRKLYPALYLLIATGHEVERYRDAAREAGADAILSKDNAPALLAKIRELLGI